MSLTACATDLTNCLPMTLPFFEEGPRTAKEETSSAMDCDVSALPPTCPSLASPAMRRRAAEHCVLAESDTISKGEKEESRDMDKVFSREGDLS